MTENSNELSNEYILEKELDRLEDDLYAKDNIIAVIIDYLTECESESLKDLISLELTSDNFNKVPELIKENAKNLATQDNLIKIMQYLRTRKIKGVDKEFSDHIHKTELYDFLGICTAGGLYSHSFKPIFIIKGEQEKAIDCMLFGFKDLLESCIAVLKLNRSFMEKNE